jgi:hypothetical protein
MNKTQGLRCAAAHWVRTPRATLWIVLIWFFTVALITMSGCAPSQPMHVSTDAPAAAPATAATIEPVPPELPAVVVAAQEPEAEPASLLPDGTGETVWARGFSGKLIAGLDGGLYKPYRPAVIERIQNALRIRGIYAGPVNGVLDAPTMMAIYEFQRSAHNVQVCGVPTPRTRRMLEQGSHTDPR